MTENIPGSEFFILSEILFAFNDDDDDKGKMTMTTLATMTTLTTVTTVMTVTTLMAMIMAKRKVEAISFVSFSTTQ